MYILVYLVVRAAFLFAQRGHTGEVIGAPSGERESTSEFRQMNGYTLSNTARGPCHTRNVINFRF